MEALGWLVIVLVILGFAVAPAFPFVRRRLGLSSDSPEAAAVRSTLRSPLKTIREAATRAPEKGGAGVESPIAAAQLAYPQQIEATIEEGEVPAVATHLDLLEQDVATFAKLDDPWGEANVLNLIGFVHERRSNFDEAVQMHTRALDLFRDTGDRVGVCDSLNNLGVVFGRLGDAEVGLEYHRQALRIREDLGAARISHSDNNLGVLLARTRAEKAREYFAEAKSLAEAVEDDRGLGKVINNSTVLSINAPMGTTEIERVCELFAEALALRSASADQRGHAKTKNNLGLVHSLRGDYPTAERYFGEAATLAGSVEDHVGLLHVLENWGLLARAFEGGEEPVERIESRIATLHEEAVLPGEGCLARDCEAYWVAFAKGGAIDGQTALFSSGSATPATLDGLRARLERDRAF
jgi:tetratricopeptide (TPR) repeat protein